MRTAAEQQAGTSRLGDLLGLPNYAKLDIVQAGYLDTFFVFLGERDCAQRPGQILDELTRQ
jgi:hypothetical protein